ncbi:uncharacterized protein JCM6883_004575 [Sporobolomyces salmoneus]|uniref:uncharacterized protein n=1 Tax=Sporobolomyces salmoneus TaxID=183962 RepID=UPI00317318D8
MSLSSLPHELRIKIAHHLQESLEGNKDGLRDQGRKLALVSRQWRELGTRMSWTRLDIDFVDDSMRSNVDHAREHSKLLHLVKEVEVTTILDSDEDIIYIRDIRGVSQLDECKTKIRQRFEKFVNLALTSCINLEHLKLDIDTLDFAQLFLSSGLVTNKEASRFPRLRSFTFFFDDSRESSGAAPCTTLIGILPTLSSLEAVDLRICTRSEATLPTSLPVTPSWPKLDKLRIDLAAFRNEDEQSFFLANYPDEIENEKTLLYLLSLPHPTRLLTLLISVSQLTVKSLSVLESFASLTSFTLRLTPDNLLGILDSLPSLLSSFRQLEHLSILVTHDIANARHQCNISHSQLQTLLDSLPDSLVSLETHFNLSDPSFQPLIEHFLASNTDGRFTRWIYYDSHFETRYLGPRRPRPNEVVLKKMKRAEPLRGGFMHEDWEVAASYYVLTSGVQYR